MPTPWRGEAPQNSLPRALEGAVGELQALLEPTPAQLAASYQRIRQTLAGLPAAPAPSSRADRASAMGNAAQPRSAAGRWRRLIADCRRATWAISGGATLALLAGFTLGRLSSSITGDSSPVVVASPGADPAPASASPPPPAQPEPGPRAAAQAAPAASEAAPAAPEPATAKPSPARATAAKRARRAESPPASAMGLCQRRDPVQRAECWLRREQPRRALQALCGAAPGQAREREQVAMLRLVAECKLGRDIRARAAGFFAEWPDSPLALRIRNECPGATSSFMAGTKSALR